MRGWEAYANISHSPPDLRWKTVSHHLLRSDEGRGFLPNALRTEMQSAVTNGLLGSEMSQNSPCSYLALFILGCETNHRKLVALANLPFAVYERNKLSKSKSGSCISSLALACVGLTSNRRKTDIWTCNV